MKILLVDDEPAMRTITQIALTRLGNMEVVTLSDGGAVVETAAREAPDCILLDVMLPDADGPEVLARLRADEATAAIPVIFLTGKTAQKDVEWLQGLGANAVVTKPFDVVALVERVRAVAGG